MRVLKSIWHFFFPLKKPIIESVIWRDNVEQTDSFNTYHDGVYVGSIRIRWWTEEQIEIFRNC